MNAVRRLLIATLAAAAFVSTGAVAADANVAGTWNIAVETGQGSGNPTATIQQDGTTLTGTYKGQLGEGPLNGSVKGNEVTWTVKLNAQGQDIVLTYTGTVDGDSMSGKVSLGEFGEGTFTAKKAA